MAANSKRQQRRGDSAASAGQLILNKGGMFDAFEETVAATSVEKCGVADENRSSMNAQIPDSELSVIEITAIRTIDHGGNSSPVRESEQRSGHRGEKVNGVVMQSRHDVREHVSCMLAHDLLNKVTAIVGFCELLASDQTDSQKEIHLHQLRVTAYVMADMLNVRACSPIIRSPGQQELVEKSMEKKSPEKVEPEIYRGSNTSYIAIQN